MELMGTHDDFAVAVQSIVGPLLTDLGFSLNSVDTQVDEGGRYGTVVYYKSADCKIQIFQSSREGSVNCMIAPLDALNVFGPHDNSFKWHYLTKFVPVPDVPLEELVKEVSFDPMTTAGELRWVRDNIQEHFEAAHAGILAMYGRP